MNIGNTSMRWRCIIVAVMLMSLMSGCSKQPASSTLFMQRPGAMPLPASGVYEVTSDHESLITIASRYGLGYQYLAARNGLVKPYRLHKGMKIYLIGNAPPSTVRQWLSHTVNTLTPSFVHSPHHSVVLHTSTVTTRKKYKSHRRVISHKSQQTSTLKNIAGKHQSVHMQSKKRHS